MRSTLLATSIGVAALSLGARVAHAQDEWTSPAPGVRVLHRRSRAATLDVVRIDPREPQARVVVPAGAEGPMAIADFAAEHDAFVALAASDRETAVLRDLAAGARATRLASCDALPPRVEAVVGEGAEGGLVILTSPGSLAREAVCETLGSLGVERVRALAGVSLRVGSRGLRRSGTEVTHALLGVRVLPGASWFAAESVRAAVVGEARTGRDVVLEVEARNTGRVAWHQHSAPTLALETPRGTLRARTTSDVPPGAVGRFSVRVSGLNAGAHTLQAQVLSPEGEALLSTPLQARVLVREAPIVPAPQPALQVQTAGLSLGGGHGPSGLAWAALSVLGCAVAVLQRRGRRDE